MLDVIFPAPGGRTSAPRDVPTHNGGRIGCNHAGGGCSELRANDVGHDLGWECTRPTCECHRLARPCGARMHSGLACVVDAPGAHEHQDQYGLRDPSWAAGDTETAG